MITLATADPHVSANPRDAYRWKFLEETLPALVAEHDVERILILGDLTETKDGHPAALVNRLVDAVVALTESAQLYFLKGNHDYVAEDVPFFRFLRHLRRVRWINEPTALELRGLGKCLFLPHTRNLEDWVDQMFDSYEWFFCHQTFGGADLGGRRADGAGPPFTKNSKVVSGDVHVPQKVGPVTYVGAPYTVDFGDDYKPRVLLLDGGKARSIPVPGPQKRLMTLSGRDPLAALGMKHPLAAAIWPLTEGDVVKVRVELPAGSEVSRADVRARVRGWAEEARVELSAVQVVAPAAKSTPAARDRHRASDADLVRAYARKMNKGKATVSAGLKLAEETP